jgi:hypothetical protein
MSRLTRVSPVLLLLALFLFASVEARADAIAITGGSVTMSYVASKWRSSFFDVRWGENSFVRGGVSDTGLASPQTQCLGGPPCPAGSNTFLTSKYILRTETPGSFFIPGALPDGPTGTVSQGGRFEGSLLSFSSGSFPFPEDPHTEDGLVTITSHFTMSGQIVVLNIAPDFKLNQVFAGDFLGSGTAIFTFGYFASTIHTLELKSVKYQFEPVPEPTTLVLLGSGIAGLAARQRRRSRLRSLQKAVS